MKKIITLFIALATATILVLTLWFTYTSQLKNEYSPLANISVVKKPSETAEQLPASKPLMQSELQKTLAGVPTAIILDLPQTNPEGVVSLSSEITDKIKWEIFGILNANNDIWPLVQGERPIDGILLVAVGKRYIAFTRPRIEWSGPLEILDLETAKISFYDVGPQTLIRDTKYVIYISPQKLYLYKPDWSGPIIIEGSEIVEPETYDFCGGCMANLLNPQFSQTDKDFTVSSFIWENERPKKTNEHTFNLPK